MGVELAAKRLGLLHGLLPRAARIALLVNPNNPDVTREVILHTQDAARSLGLEIVVVEAATEREIEILLTAGYGTSPARSDVRIHGEYWRVSGP